MATISFKTMSYLFIGSPESCGSDLIECLLERQRLNDMAVMQECSSRLCGEGFKPSPEWNEYLGKYGSEPEFVAQTVSYMNASVDPKSMYNWAETIVSALKQSGIHKLIFMVRLVNGHVISDDIATIATVMGSIHQDEIPFSIIVYETGVLQRVDVLVKDEVSKKVAEAMTYTKCATSSILFAPELPKRCEEIHAVAEFIKTGAPTVQIEPTLVRAMECGAFDKTRRALQERKQLLPTGEVPEMEVGTSAHKFESTASTEVTFLTLTDALRFMDAEFTYRPNWIVSILERECFG